MRYPRIAELLFAVTSALVSAKNRPEGFCQFYRRWLDGLGRPEYPSLVFSTTLDSMSQAGRSYRLYLETRCAMLISDGSISPCPPPWAPLQPKIRSAVRGEDCSLCGTPIPGDRQVDPDPKEYLYPKGLVRLHGLHYTGAPDGTTSCLSVWQDVSKAAWGKN